MAVIERKVSGEKPEPAQRSEPTNITDLMAALEASVAAARQDRREAGAADAAPKAAKPKAARRKAAVAEAEAPPKRRRKTA
jgi:non-homologous end joining protein Ku